MDWRHEAFLPARDLFWARRLDTHCTFSTFPNRSTKIAPICIRLFADRKSAERRAVEIEHDIRAGIHGWKSTIPSFAEWWAVYRKTYTPLKSARNRDAQIVAHFLPYFGATRLDEITKSDIVRYLNLRRTDMTGNSG